MYVCVCMPLRVHVESLSWHLFFLSIGYLSITLDSELTQNILNNFVAVVSSLSPQSNLACT